jgi:hypothetical protein
MGWRNPPQLLAHQAGRVQLRERRHLRGRQLDGA